MSGGGLYDRLTVSRRIVVVLAIVLAACTGDTEATSPTSTLPPDLETTTTSFTTTTIAVDTCDDVTDDVAELFRDLVRELDGLSTAAFLDRRLWPEQLFFLENAGVQLDARIDVLGCDLATVQNVALDRVGDLDASSYPAQELLRHLLGG